MRAAISKKKTPPTAHLFSPTFPLGKASLVVSLLHQDWRFGVIWRRKPGLTLATTLSHKTTYIERAKQVLDLHCGGEVPRSSLSSLVSSNGCVGSANSIS